MSSAERPTGSGNRPGPDSTDTFPSRNARAYHIDVDRGAGGIWRRWTATERTTGTEASGPFEIVALVVLCINILASDSDAARDSEAETGSEDPAEVWREATAETKRRFDEENVTEDEVEDAIEWARSQ
jgi:hypothetical protein